MLHHEPEWVRTCKDCSTWLMNAKGEFQTYGEGIRIPATSTPCWSCGKYDRKIPADSPLRKPLPEGADFGEWVWDLMDWFREGRACGFGEIDDLMRQVAGVIDAADRRAEADRSQRIMLDVLTVAVKRR